MEKIVILSDPQRIDERLVNTLRQLFPECEVHIVAAETPSSRQPEASMPLAFLNTQGDGAN